MKFTPLEWEFKHGFIRWSGNLHKHEFTRWSGNLNMKFTSCGVKFNNKRALFGGQYNTELIHGGGRFYLLLREILHEIFSVLSNCGFIINLSRILQVVY